MEQMRDHELELIAALAEGRLEDDAKARALVDSSPELRAEYEAQRMAYLALTGVGSATLTDTERAGLHRDIWSELRAGDTPAPAGTPWYYRWVPALAGMFVVVGLIAVLNQGGDDSGGNEIAQLSATTQATSDADVPTPESTDEATEGSEAGADQADAGSDGSETMEETDGTQPPPEDSRSISPAATEFYSAEADMVRSGALGEDTGGEGGESDTAECLREADLSGYVPLGVQVAPLQTGIADLESIQVPTPSDPVIVAIPEGTDLASAIIAFVDQLDCDLIYVDR
jgi:hypothetical protein